MKNKTIAKKKRVRRHIDWGRILFLSFLMVTAIAGSMMPVFAATVWEKATEIMKDVYNQIVLISTIAAIVTASIALLLMNFSKSGCTVDESRSWLKRIPSPGRLSTDWASSWHTLLPSSPAVSGRFRNGKEVTPWESLTES